MKKRIITISAVAVLAVVIIFIIVSFAVKAGKNSAELQFAQVEKGDITSVISATGTIDAQKTVDVGTQVSGTISKIYVDFNDHVKKDQVIAVLDTTLLKIAVDSANSDLMKADSQYELAQKDYDNNVVLNTNKLLSDFDLETSKVNRDAAYAAKLAAETNLKKAKANLDYAIIRSPIDGTVLERSVEEGQTVAASLSAPTLFTIAEDLSNIQIEAQVAESDIGNIKIGQKADFTVEAYPDENFTGTVDEIHLKPTVTSNVVNYTVIVYAKNRKNMLLPGMTATIDFIIDEKKDAMLLPNAALRFKPTEAMLKKLSKNAPKFGQNRNHAGRRHWNNSSNGSSQGENKGNQNQNRQVKKNFAQLWYIDANNELNFLIIQTGITNGLKTEIISNKVQPDMKFISGYGSASKNNSTQQGGHFPMRRMF